MDTINVTKNGTLTLQTAGKLCQEDIVVNVQIPVVETEQQYVYYLDKSSERPVAQELDIIFSTDDTLYNKIKIIYNEDSSTNGQILFTSINEGDIQVATFKTLTILDTTTTITWRQDKYRIILTREKASIFNNFSLSVSTIATIETVKN